MTTSLSILIVLAALAAGSGAMADDDDCVIPMAQWQPRAAVEQMAEAQGWTVLRLRIDDGCYEINGRDAEGRAIEVKLDPGTLAVVEFEFEE